MGATGSTEIHVNFHNRTSFYFAGDPVSGTVEFQNSQDKIRIDHIFLEFTGELGYTSQESREYIDKNNRARTEHETRYHQVPFITNRFPVVHPQQGQNEITLYRGHHSWPFQFTIPQSLPPTSIPSSNLYPYVKYYVRIFVDKPWFKPTAKHIYSFIVFPRVNILHNSFGPQLLQFSNQNRKKLCVEGSLLQPGIVPGRKLGLYIHLKNPKQSEIKRIKMILTQYRRIGTNDQTEVIFTMDLPGLTEFSGLDFERTFDIQIPPGFLSPTYASLPNHIGQIMPIQFRYELQLEVKARGLFTDFKIVVPVVVGTEPVADETPSLVNNFVAIERPSAPVFEHDEPPPSYESVVTDRKL